MSVNNWKTNVKLAEVIVQLVPVVLASSHGFIGDSEFEFELEDSLGPIRAVLIPIVESTGVGMDIVEWSFPFKDKPISPPILLRHSPKLQEQRACPPCQEWKIS
jgi:hypothetical protein